MYNKFQNILHSELVRNSAKLLSANVVAQAIGLIVYPILTRLYSPADFGLLNLFLSIGGVFALLSTAEYQYAIVLPKEDKEARTVIYVCIKLLVCVVVFLLLSVTQSSYIAQLFNTPELRLWYWLIPIFVLVIGMWNICSCYYTRVKQFGKISFYQLSQSSLSAVAKVGFGWIGWTQAGLLVSSVFAPFIALIGVIGTKLCREKNISRSIRPSSADCLSIAKTYRNFPMYSLPRALMNNIGGNMPTLLLTPFFGLKECGFWGMALTLGFRPINIICNSIYQVIFQRITEDVNNRKTIRRFLLNYIKQIFIFAIPCFVVLFCVLPFLTEMLLGTEWKSTSVYLQIMLPWLLMVLVVSSMNFIPDVFFRQKTYLIFEIVYTTLRFVALLTGILLHSMIIAVALFCIVGSILLLCQLLWFVQIVNKYEKSL